ncbi:uncharacterized protein B0H18DRAFT_1006042 [Fomitopsis serialis]|uniref:uncharacterized protein n=1 Tax=Fomitopsis serialis TaxID=139415 RepID=UPI002008DF12|nr:uncharacterized protein B0H18DRAFT_1006042 [Neoantrodia serialis]KAH9926426.1 hypothetical protein B0H18DRAFT_1006042 [Neoantrodia serialis]
MPRESQTQLQLAQRLSRLLACPRIAVCRPRPLTHGKDLCPRRRTCSSMNASSTGWPLNVATPRAGATAIKKRKPRPVVTGMTEGTSWPWTASLGMTEYESKEQRLHDEIVAYAAYISSTVQESMRARSRARIGDTFGSTAHNLYFPTGLTITQRTVARKARVPVVSFETAPELGSFKCDINISSVSGTKSVLFIAEYMSSMPALRPIILVVKAYLHRIQLGSAAFAGLNSYGVILLVISFLQRNPKNLPSDDITKPLERESLGRLLLGFLEHYGFDFDYADSVVSVAKSGLVTKASKGWVDETQPADLLSIEDPVNPDNDVGRAASRIEQVRTAFCEAYKELQLYPLSMVHTNALGTILGMSPEVVARREKIREMVDTGSLNRALQDVWIPPEGYVPRRSRDPTPLNGHTPYPPPQYQQRPYSGFGHATEQYTTEQYTTEPYPDPSYGALPPQQSPYEYDAYGHGYGGGGRASDGHSASYGAGQRKGRAGKRRPP